MTALLVMLGGAAGAVLRHVADRLLPRHGLPWGVLAANVAGSFLLGLLGGVLSGAYWVLAGPGFCGALTTYSTFGHQTVELAQRQPLRAFTYVTLTLTAGLGAVWLGRVLA